MAHDRHGSCDGWFRPERWCDRLARHAAIGLAMIEVFRGADCIGLGIVVDPRDTHLVRYASEMLI